MVLINLKTQQKIQKQLKKAYAIGKYSAGWRLTDIALELDMPKSTLFEWIRSYQATNSFERKAGSGRPRKTTRADDDYILKLVRDDLFITEEEIRKTLDDGGICQISERTVRRRISESGEYDSISTISFQIMFLFV
jgi:transposase